MTKSVSHWGFTPLLPCGVFYAVLLHEPGTLHVSAVALPSTLYCVPNHLSFRWHWPSLAADRRTRLALWGLSWLRASAMICNFKTILQFTCSCGSAWPSWDSLISVYDAQTSQPYIHETCKYKICACNMPNYMSIYACIIQYAYIFLTSKHVIRVQRTFTSGLYSNRSWSPVRKSSFGNSCMFSQRLST